MFKIALHLGLAECDVTIHETGGSRTEILTGESACFIAPYSEHSIRWKNEAPFIWFFVENEYLQLLGLGHLQGITCIELAKLIRKDLSIFRLAALFYDACMAHEEPVDLYVEAKSTLLATRLLRAQFKPSEPTVYGKGGIHLAAYQRVVAYIQSKLAVPEARYHRAWTPTAREVLSNGALARVAGMSEHHFIRQFRERAKRTPQDFVMQCRLDKAEELIVAHGYSPKEAAYTAGFCEAGHFYRRFRQRYGKSPHALMKQAHP